MGESRRLHLSLHINQSLGAWLPRESMEKDQRLRIRAQTGGMLNEVVPTVSPAARRKTGCSCLCTFFQKHHCACSLCLNVDAECASPMCIISKLVIKETMKRQKSSHSQGLASSKTMHCILLTGKLLSPFALACCYVKNL